MKLSIVKILFLYLLFLNLALAEENKKLNFFDSQDNYLDLSDFVINAHGFVPVPAIITEPAVGGFGLGLFPVFIKPNKPMEKNGKTYPVMPDITVAGGAYTANDSWFLAGGQMGIIEKYGIHYKIFGGYANANLDFYVSPKLIKDDLEIGVNMRVVPVYVSLSKQIIDPRFTLGFDYLFADVDVRLEDKNDIIPDKWEKDFKSVQSRIGLIFEFDNRDNIFTPNKGFKLSLNARANSKLLGSDENFQELQEYIYWYFPVMEQWISGIRLDYQQMFGSPPFYSKPYVSMRGVPAVKYQGDYTGLVELEERFDFGKTKRWSLVAFGGLGKAINSGDKFSDSDLVYSYGFGGRYLLANKLKLRCGLDFAWSNDNSFAFYIVFGNNWGF